MPVIKEALAALMPPDTPYCMDTLAVLLPRGYALGVLQVQSCHQINAGYKASPQEMVMGDFRPDRYHWIAGERRKFPDPVKLKGRQRIFYTTDSRVLAAASREAA